MKNALALLFLFTTVTAFGAEFRRIVEEYNNTAGVLAVSGSNGREYALPLNDAVDEKFKNARQWSCVILKGSLGDSEGKDIFVRDMRDC